METEKLLYVNKIHCYSRANNVFVFFIFPLPKKIFFLSQMINYLIPPMYILSITYYGSVLRCNVYGDIKEYK